MYLMDIASGADRWQAAGPAMSSPSFPEIVQDKVFS